MPDTRELVIIGSGPAGLTAAIYAARASLKPLLLEGEPSSTSDQPGGQLMLTTDVENYPGFPEGIMGPELMVRFREQAAKFGTEIITAKATRVDLAERPFKIWTGDAAAPEPDFVAQSVIVASGAQSLMLGLDVTGLFVAIGHRPNTDLLKGQLDLHQSGYLVTTPGTTITNVEGVFGCGDVQDDYYRQAITAAGSGCMAAIDAERWLESQHD